MSYAPAGEFDPNAWVLSPWSEESIGLGLRMVGSGGPAATGVAWPSANFALFFPFQIDAPVTVRKAFYNVVTASGNVDIGIYSFGGIRLVSAGATASVSGFNLIDIADVLLDQGRYFMALASSSTQQFLTAGAPAAPTLQCFGVKSQSVFPLPGTAAWGDSSNTTTPHFGFNLYTVDL